MFPDVACVAGDAARVPLKDGEFDLITSQFGMEYAGADAFSEASRLLRPRGRLAVALHVREGGIYQECRINQRAADMVRECNLFGVFQQLVRTFHHARRSIASKAMLRTAHAKFVTAVAKTEEILHRWGEAVATRLVLRLRNDVVRMSRRIDVYDANALVDWADSMTVELCNYSRRMASMLAAALSPEMTDRLLARLHGDGLRADLRKVLTIGNQPIPAAWLVTATKIG